MEYKYTRIWKLNIDPFHKLANKILNLKDCNRLRLFPTSIKSLLALKNLNIRRYSNLTLFPNELGNLTSMTTFDIS
uniref:Uncharacterized protein n=1 Tax=Physcomitrium patens TaxID=3218 RepID=A0A7I4BKU6_PHYPA